MADATTTQSPDVAALQAELARLREERKAAERAAVEKAQKAAAEEAAKLRAELDAAKAEAAKVAAEFAAHKRDSALWAAAQKAGVVSQKLLGVLDTQGLDPAAADFAAAFEARAKKWRESDPYAFAAASPAVASQVPGTGHGNEPSSGGTSPGGNPADGAARLRAQAKADFAALFGGRTPAVAPAATGGK